MKSAASSARDVFKFGSNPVNPRLVFFSNASSFAFLAPNPILNLKGHSIITPKRNVSIISELSPSELFDLSLQTQFLSQILKKYYKGSAMTIYMRDGQTQYDNCCVHIIPRKADDIPYNDDIYKELEGFINSLYDEIKSRDFTHLDEQCQKLKHLIREKEKRTEDESWVI